ncbi:TM2 domain-containing protein [Minwuia sp.]|uniref:TM2 domain-containing protein n=1 Tax=Minwuia sp. TaxID=2493630 RepID=UPI003A90461B
MSRPDAEFPGGNDNQASANAAEYEDKRKSVLAAYVVWFFLGWLGLHRVYLGRIVSAVLMFVLWLIGSGITAVIWLPIFLIPWGLWWLLDAFLIPGMVASENKALFDRIERGR